MKDDKTAFYPAGRRINEILLKNKVAFLHILGSKNLDTEALFGSMAMIRIVDCINNAKRKEMNDDAPIFRV